MHKAERRRSTTVPAEIVTLWRTARVRCEYVSTRLFDTRVLLWVGSTLAFEQLVATYPDAQQLAKELRRAYAYLS
jgi:hypothetical protein